MCLLDFHVLNEEYPATRFICNLVAYLSRVVFPALWCDFSLLENYSLVFLCLCPLPMFNLGCFRKITLHSADHISRKALSWSLFLFVVRNKSLHYIALTFKTLTTVGVKRKENIGLIKRGFKIRQK